MRERQRLVDFEPLWSKITLIGLTFVLAAFAYLNLTYRFGEEWWPRFVGYWFLAVTFNVLTARTIAYQRRRRFRLRGHTGDYEGRADRVAKWVTSRLAVALAVTVFSVSLDLLAQGLAGPWAPPARQTFHVGKASRLRLGKGTDDLSIDYAILRAGRNPMIRWDPRHVQFWGIDVRWDERGWSDEPLYPLHAGPAVNANVVSIKLSLYWPLALSSLPLLAAWVAMRVRNRFRPKPGFCCTCGYDLRASEERCPECGTPIADAGNAIGD